MPRKGLNIYKRKDGRWEGRYPLGRKSNGRIRYGYIYGKDYTEVKEQLLQLRKHSINSLHYQSAGAITYQQWSSQWLNDIEQTVKMSTFAGYNYKIRHYFWPHLGACPLYQITSQMIQTMIDEWLEHQISVSSIKLFMTLLQKTLSNAVEKGLIETSPCTEVIFPKFQKPRIRALSLTEQKRLEQVIEGDGHPKALAVLMALHTGMRIGEIAALKWQNVRFDQNILVIESTYQRLPASHTNQTILHYAGAKSSSSHRVIPMSAKLRQELIQLSESRTGVYVFASKKGPCEPRLLTYHFHRIREKAQLGKVHFHQLRHTFATRCLESGADIASVSALLGHASTQMTLDIYADSLLEQRICAIEAMEQALMIEKPN